MICGHQEDTYTGCFHRRLSHIPVYETLLRPLWNFVDIHSPDPCLKEDFNRMVPLVSRIKHQPFGKVCNYISQPSLPFKQKCFLRKTLGHNKCYKRMVFKQWIVIFRKMYSYKMTSQLQGCSRGCSINCYTPKRLGIHNNQK